MTFAATERAELGALLLELGPEAPTLCTGWTTRDMAVHLLLRETRPDALPGLFVPGFGGHLRSVSEKIGARDYSEIVRKWASGPPRFSPLRLIDAQVNTVEHFIHHEDVRRARPGWKPRSFSLEDEQQMLVLLRRGAARLLRKSVAPVILDPEGASPIVAAGHRGIAGSGSDVVRVAGPVGEILVFCFGRQADVTVRGERERICFTRV
ncbi:TIGR03085 family metal-binding protein [Corynebacterium sp. CCM 9204]|uniref:TIGR03085 family metal-binding protein n=1 Tax=Corynebacterium sp. CCM 9204 TaxID=3057616 RepID=UPI00352352B1